MSQKKVIIIAVCAAAAVLLAYNNLSQVNKALGSHRKAA